MIYFKVYKFPISRYADQVSVGDEVLSVKNDHVITTKVINISSLTIEGNYHLKYNRIL